MKILLAAAVGMLLFVVSGCSTTKGSCVTLENRVQSLENRLQVLEGDVQTSSVSGYAGDTFVGKSTSSVSVDDMTKKQIQQALKNAGYYDGNIDGKIGPKSKEAIREFQRDMGLKVDGVAGAQTKQKLLKYL